MGYHNLLYCKVCSCALFPISHLVLPRKITLTTMASFAISTSLQRASGSIHVTKRLRPLASPVSSVETKQDIHVVTQNVEGQKGLNIGDQLQYSGLQVDKSGNANDKLKHGFDTIPCVPKVPDTRWKNGTWDLNMFVKNGKMDWDSLIAAEAKRRKFLEVYPGVTTDQEPVLFRSSIIPWWAWLKSSYLPEAELINGRAAMVGFFMAYIVDALTRLDLVGQTGNFISKAALFVTVIGVILVRRTEDFWKAEKAS
ncbi:hypothetical protein HS088_TW18G00959 [Tripterygium wilfordii]|uniref:Uncharacterized protein n=1 Tax=Tripterygium wilfordii TaxID=458696 RepID=A0A7J7CEG1_TRIWF|nr:hypothetical protein HS088_TW18G00959 [Tripterygium wilfordii]